ncbi:MAG TPA: hypothetical protein VIU12_18140 [Chryseolinea sp.]
MKSTLTFLRATLRADDSGEIVPATGIIKVDTSHRINFNMPQS